MKQKILVVDDESEAVELVEFNLKQAGFEVISAADGEEAVKKAKASLPALVVLDLMLPEIDGSGSVQTPAPRFRHGQDSHPHAHGESGGD
jgi:two-component system alkaline phosphatase synthesis response regulator PhoP